MSIIYSYPETTSLNDNDTLIGTSSALVGGKKKNITRNFSLGEIRDYVSSGGVINPAATDFKLAVFNQNGTKITDSIVSQDALTGTGIVVAGTLRSTAATFNGLITGSQGALIYGGDISLNSTTQLGGPVKDAIGNQGFAGQILLSDSSGRVSWTNYSAGLTYQGTWNAATNTPTLTSGQGVNGHFYIVNVAGNTSLDGETDWKVGDWAVFVEQGVNDKWQKIDNTSVLIGEGTPNTIAMWVGGTTPSTTLNDSIITELNNVISIAGDLSTQGLEVNKYLRDGAGNDGIDGQVLTSTTVNGDKEVVWTTPTTGTVTGSGTGQVLSKFSGTGTGQTVLEDSLVSETSSLNFNVTATAVSSTATILTFTDTTNNPTNITVGGTLTVDVTSVGGPGIVVINVTNVNNQVITATAPSPGYVGYVRNALDGSYSNIPTVYNGVSAGISIAGELDMSTNKITNVVDPTDAQDAATKSYVDSATVSGSGTIGTLPVFTGTDVLGDSVVTQSANALTVDTTGEIRLAGAGISTSATDAVPLGLIIASNGHVKTGSVGDIYTINAGVKSGNSVPLNLDAASGTDSTVSLTEGTGITLTRTSATEITIDGVAQGITGSGTVGKLPKFGTTTSLDDSIVTEGNNTTTIIPLNEGGQIQASINFNMQSSVFDMVDYATRNTVTGPAPQVGDVFNFVLTSDLTWAVGGGVIPAGTYPFTVTFVGSGSITCNFNSYQTTSGATGTGYNNLVGNGSSTSVSSSNTLSIDGELSMATHQIKNVVNPTDTQDAATKNYVDSIPRGVMTFGTSDSGATITVSGGAPDPRVKANTTGGVVAGSTSLATGDQIKTAIDTAISGNSVTPAIVQGTTITSLPGIFWSDNNVASSSYPALVINGQTPGGSIDLSTTSWQQDLISFQFGSPGPINPNSGAPARTQQDVWDQADALRAAIGWPAAGVTTTATDITFTLSFTDGQTITITQPAGNLGTNTNGSSISPNVPLQTTVQIGTASNPIVWSAGSGTINAFSNEPSAPPAGFDSYGLPSNAEAAVYIDAELNMLANKISNVEDPVGLQDAATKNYVDTQDANYLPLAGGTMTGAIALPGIPTLALEAATKSYVDNTLAGSGSLIFQGSYDAVNNVPNLTSGTGILKGWTYAVTAGPSTSFWSPPLDVGDLIIANIDNPTSAADWTEVQSNIGIAGSGATDLGTTKGIAGFSSDDFTVSSSGWVEAKDFNGSTPGYVPDATNAVAGTFLKEDGTWSTAGVTGTGTQNYVTKWSAGAAGIQNSTIFDNGNVGIGTTTPAAKLDVAAVTGAAIRLTSTGNGLGANAIIGSLEYYGSDNSAPGVGVKSSIVSKTEASLGDDSNLIFSTSNGVTNNIERMRIDSAGNVGIGTDSPTSLLSVRTAGTSGSEDFVTFSRGTSPETEVLKISRNAGDVRFLAEQNITLSADHNDDQGNVRSNIILKTDNVEAMRIDGNGRVGIGTSSPAVSLDISATDAVQMPVGLTGDRPAGVNGMLRYNSSDNEFEGYIDGNWGSIGGSSASGTGTAVTYFDGLAGQASTSLTSDPNIVIDQGYLGVGTNQPDTQLHVKSSVNELLKLESITSSQKIRFTDINNQSDDCDFGSTSGDLAMFTNNFGFPNTQTFTFNKDGKLGINQTLPSYSLDIQDSNFDPAIRLFAPNSSSEILIQANQSFGNNNLINSNTNDLDFQGNGSSIMTLGVNNNAGSVILGQYGQGQKTGVATYNLAVDPVGKIIEVAASSAPSIHKETFLNLASNTFDFLLPPNINPIDENYVNVFIDGIYQNTNNINSVTTSPSNVTTVSLVSAAPAGTSVEIVATT